jgi:ATP/maltotriose-dependent transcriptional regulator MalT
MPPREQNIMLEGMSGTERTAYLQEMSDGYKQSQHEAELRRDAAEEAHDDHESKSWGAIAEYCGMMANLVLHGVLDEPATHLSFYSYDERIGDKRLLIEIMQDRESGKEKKWTQAHQNVLGSALWVLTIKERQVAELYYIAKVKRKSLPELLNMPLSTLDTHIRNINAKWRAFVGDVENSIPVQSSWLATLHEVTEMPNDVSTPK